ncbi:T9SS type A sorting domain-containing protein [Winogradskyella thalassocola]|uniref:Por secretion system C-terminal sorting domain-containing protein n=1 Tax=Winogradskyella thalassocola TaxID=262004 RepID=A0A1G7WNQ7_9FLAO|nr:T9SS type A sorting domain-containing protein [Winogradskyella thalassocola]SDG73591.1 Por secretion system C-terminal sorting domain-containing protein [Winogradskyella thalassocola]
MNPILSFVSSKKAMTTFMLLLSMSFYAQIIISDVFPTRVTKSSVVTLVGSGFTNSSTVSIYGISTSSVSATPDGTELSFEITTDGTNDISNVILKVNGNNVYLGSNASENLVKIDYVGAKLKRNDRSDGSQSFEHVTEIFTNWNHNGQGYWRSSSYVYRDKSTYPNDYHELIGFTYDGVTYSTGVDNALLSTINGLNISNEVFKAYSTNGITGTINSGANFIATADLVDGVVNEGTVITSDDVADLTVFQVMIDGKNGLELGTGVTNYNQTASIRFFSGNGQVGAINDGIPDLLITQIADSGSWDTYYYADDRGNVIGTPIKLFLNNGHNNQGRWQLDLYKLPSGADINTAVPQSRTYDKNEDRLIKLIALNLEDFDLDASNIDSVKNINSVAGGSADMAFIAYNQSAFDIKAPIAAPLLPQFVCKADGTTDITFNVNAGIDDGFGGITDPPVGETDLELKYKWRKYNSEISDETNESFTISGVKLEDLATYKIEISNDNGGTIILPVTLSEGGTPYYWNGTDWSSPYGAVEEKERGLVYTGDYTTQSEDLVGCDCRVTSGSNVVIPEGKTMLIYNEITVEPEVLEVKQLDEFGNVEKDVEGNDIILVNHLPAATFTLEDDASLVQINDVENSGEITVKRTLRDEEVKQYDYIYWSSPVEDFNISEISNTPTYQWNVNAGNNGSGNGDWESASNAIMTPGEGYIVRVANNQVSGFTTEFYGAPNNGPFSIDVYKSPNYLAMNYHDSSWNLIGNPYPSAIDAEKFLTANSDLEGRVDIWTHDTYVFDTGATNPFYDNFGVNYGNQYITYNALGTSTPSTFNGDIASGQAFFVRVDNAAPNTTSVNFTNAMRHNNFVSYDNSDFFRNTEDTAVATEKQLVWLSLSDENNGAISTLIGYAEGATDGKDRLYDAYTNNEGFNLYSLISDDEKLVIQGLPLPFVNSNTVPLGMELVQSGIYKIAIGKVEGSLFEAQEQAIYLEDTYTGVIHNLRTSPYTFTGEAGVFDDRFVLRYTPSITLSVNEISASNTFAYISDAMFYVKSSKAIETVEVFDMNGKQIVNYTVKDNTNSFSTQFAFANGIYIANIKLDNGSVVTKKLIN